MNKVNQYLTYLGLKIINSKKTNFDLMYNLNQEGIKKMKNFF